MKVWNEMWKKISVWNEIWNGRFLVWNERKLSVWNIEKSSSIPLHIMPCRQHKSNRIAYKVNLPVFFTLNTISCFIQSRDVVAEAGSGSGESG